MTELERALASLAPEIEWPATPRFELRLDAAPRPSPRRRRILVVAIALGVVALGVALAVPQARSAILRFLHVGGATIERVETLPAAEERDLAADLGVPVGRQEAAATLGGPVLLPRTDGSSQLYLREGVVSALIATPDPVLVSQFRSESPFGMLKKVAGTSTGVEWVQLAPGIDGLWIVGRPHVIFWPEAPPRLAGNVLLWERYGVTYRLEGPNLTRDRAIELAGEMLEG